MKIIPKKVLAIATIFLFLWLAGGFCKLWHF